ncbi:MAG TPA: AsmA family protein [Alphaproteobacteria bacterium]|nr:AsmA family protein [Alphaproteobacteria bacterium]
MSDIDMRFGEVPVTGSIDANFTDVQPKITANLAAGQLVLDRFLPEAAEADRAAGAGPAARGSARWSRERLDLSVMRSADLDLTLKLAALQRRDIRIDGADLHASLVAGLLEVDRFTGSAFGGRADISGSLNTADDAPRIDIRIAGKGMEAGGAFGTLFGFDRLQGPVDVRLTLRTSGENELALVSGLAGDATVSGTVNARLTREERTRAGVAGAVGTLLGRKVKEAGFASDALVTLLQAFADAPSALSGDATIENGRARTESLTLVGTGAQAVTVGVADLANWTIDSATTLRRDVDAGGDPYMVITLKGPLDDPDIRSSGTWLRGPAPAPETPAPEGPSVQPEQAAPEAPKKVDPEDLFFDLLRKRLEQ